MSTFKVDFSSNDQEYNWILSTSHTYIPPPKLIHVINTSLYHLMTITHSSHPHFCLGNYQSTLCFYEFSFFLDSTYKWDQRIFSFVLLTPFSILPSYISYMLLCFRLLQNLAAERRKHLASHNFCGQELTWFTWVSDTWCLTRCNDLKF